VCPVAAAGRIYFASGKGARKVRNLRANPHVALAFDRYTENWQRLAGAMIIGTATIIDQGGVFRRARQALYRKYKLYPRRAPIDEGQSVIVCITPTSSFSWGL
jgi:nitroimidazol reductase NimA-like FMN-containing flavoprotein (pyridoxamine 5'-phosphate oxidase superfamily)